MTNVEKSVTASTVKTETKYVRNRGGHRVELFIDGKVVVFLPGETVEIPSSFSVPTGLGLHVR